VAWLGSSLLPGRNPGFGVSVKPGLAHEAYDDPVLSADSSDVLEPGMVINIETPYYEFGFGAVNIEDPILIERDGTRRLGTLSDALITID
jgi:Xaa-Pro aminopeptidase